MAQPNPVKILLNSSFHELKVSTGRLSTFVSTFILQVSTKVRQTVAYACLLTWPESGFRRKETQRVLQKAMAESEAESRDDEVQAAWGKALGAEKLSCKIIFGQTYKLAGAIGKGVWE